MGLNKEVRKFFRFMPVVDAIAAMSKDPSTQVGAIALDDNYNIIAVGYNGFPRGVRDTDDRYQERETKLRLIAHAEQNLVAQAAYGGRSLKGATVLVKPLFPCSNCTKSLIQAGVKRIITVHPDFNPRWKEESAWSSIMLMEAGVEVFYFSEGEEHACV